MNKRIIQAFIILIVILFGVSVISESNRQVGSNQSINKFEEMVSNGEEVENGVLEEVEIFKEDSSNLLSTINSKIASFIVVGLNKILRLGIKVIDKLAG